MIDWQSVAVTAIVEHMTFSIRQADEADAVSMLAVLNPIIEAGCFTILDQPFTEDEQREFVRRFPARGTFLVAVDDKANEVIGMQDVQPLAPDVTSLQRVGEIATFVSLATGRRGIGSALMRATLAAAPTLGFRKIMATIRADNPSALAFYQGHGFEVIGTARQHAFVQGRYVDEVITERLL